MRLWLLLFFICTSAGSLLAQVVGGAGVCHVDQDPNTISDLEVQDDRTDCQVAMNTATGVMYHYDATLAIGNRWVEDSSLGPAGGHLSGAYPNPTIAEDSIGAFELDLTGVTAGTYMDIKQLTVTAQGRITAILGAQEEDATILVIDTWLGLDEISPEPGDLVFVQGHWNPGDGGSGLYQIFTTKIPGYNGAGEVQTAAGNFARLQTLEPNVTQFGAFPNTSPEQANDQLQISDALNFASASGIHRVYVPEGYYATGGFSNYIECPDSIFIRGAGIGKTVIYKKESSTETIRGIDGKYIRLEDLTFAGRSGIQFSRIVNFQGVENIFVDRCEFTMMHDNFQEGFISNDSIPTQNQQSQMLWRGASQMRVYNSEINYCQIKAAGQNGGDARGIWIENNRFYETNDFAISVVSIDNNDDPEDEETIQNVYIRDNEFMGNYGAGYIFFGADGSVVPADTTHNIFVTDNVMSRHYN
ncbi:MAG: hypothetical protein AAFY91_02050, partial [Bacteroidota bacterium]